MTGNTSGKISLAAGVCLVMLVIRNLLHQNGDQLVAIEQLRRIMGIGMQ
jgi:hypothetical protein